jgi:hypothetical protein
MNSQEAKFILQAYRHNGADARDPHFAEALAQAARDPQLAAWVAEDQELHRLLNRSLRAIPVPADLKINILAGGKIVRPAFKWRQSAWLAAAAAVMLLLSMTIRWLPREDAVDYAAFRETMSRFLNTEFNQTLDLATNDVPTLHQWLENAKAPIPSNLPSGLVEGAGLGCRVLDFHGSKVSLVCFRARGEVVHLFVIDNPG